MRKRKLLHRLRLPSLRTVAGWVAWAIFAAVVIVVWFVAAPFVVAGLHWLGGLLGI